MLSNEAATSTGPPRTIIGQLLRGEFGATVDPTATAAEQVFALIAELCETTPTVLIVDDLQWADPTTTVWQRLAISVDRLPLLLIGTTRPVPQRAEVLTIRRVIGDHNTIRLDRLPDTAVTTLVTELSDGQPGESLLTIAADAAGNPLYVTELVAALTRADRLTHTADGMVEVRTGPVPKSLLAAIADRLDFLRHEVRRMLQAAALLGTEFLVADLAVVQNCRVADLVSPLDQACAAGVLVEAAETFSFRHPLIRAALYEEISVPVRSAWHCDAAKALVHAGAPVHRVARHLLQAFEMSETGLLDEVLLDWLAGAASMLVAQTPGMAIELLKEACDRSSVTTTRGAWFACRLAEAYYRSGNGNEAERVARHAMAVVTSPDVLVDLHSTMAQCHALVGRTNESLQSLEQAITLPGVSSRQRSRLLVLAARAHRNVGQVAVAGEMATNALVTANEAGDIWAMGWSLHVLTVVSIMQGDVAGALPLFDRALSVVDDDPALTDLGLLLRINKSVALGDLDRYDEAVETATRVRQLADHTGGLIRLAQARSALGELLFEAGRWDAAQAEVEALADDVKDPGTTCCDRGYAAMMAFHRGDALVARQHLSAAAGCAEQIGTRMVSSLAVARSLEYEVVDEPGRALAVLTACLASTEELDELEDLLPEAARLAAQINATTVLADVASRAETFVQRSQVPHRLGTFAYCRGLLDRSASLLLVAAEKYGEAGRLLLRAKALEAAAINLAEQGDRGAGRSAFVRADDIYEQLGASWDVARLRAAFRQYGMRRGPRTKHRQVESGWDSLTPSEAKVAAMVADGLSNRQIAERLVLSTRTVESHVSHILAKLGVRSRVDIARGRMAN